jgi:hypothetical protein
MIKRVLTVFSIIVFFFLSTCHANAQVVNFDSSNEKEKLFKAYTNVKGTLNLGDNGSIVVTGISFPNGATVVGKLPDDKIWHFDAEGKLVWKKTADEGNFLLATPDNLLFYIIKANEDKFYSKTTHLNRISVIDGTERKVEIEGKEEFGKNLQTIICDNNFLFFVTTEDGNEKHDKKKTTEKLVFNRFDHQKLAHTKLTIDTPPIEGGEENSFWSFIGQKGEVKFFASKHADVEAGKNDFIILSVLPDGKVINTVKFSSSLSNGKFTRPAYALSSVLNSAINIQRLDYETRTGIKNSGGTPTSYSRTAALPTAFGHIIYDGNLDKFLIYGLYGDKPYKKLGPIYKGSYITCLDLDGKVVWSAEQPAGDQLMEEGYFRVHATPVDRDIQILTTEEKKIALNISFKDINAPFLFSSEGKFLKKDFIKYTKSSPGFDLKVFGTEQKSKVKNYLNSLPKDNKATAFEMMTAKGEVLIFFSPKEKIFKTVLFKN